MNAFDERFRRLASAARRAPERSIPMAPPYLAARARAASEQPRAPQLSRLRLTAGACAMALLYVCAIPYVDAAVMSVKEMSLSLADVPRPPALPTIPIPPPPAIPKPPVLPRFADVAADLSLEETTP